MKRYSDKRNIINLFLLHLCVIEILILAGEVRICGTLGNIRYFSIFLISSFLFNLTTIGRLTMSSYNFKLLAGIIGWMLLCNVIFNDIYEYRILRFIIFPLGTCFILSACDFNEFRNLLLKYLTILSFVSIVVQIGHDYFNIFPASSYIFEDHIRRLSLGYFTTEWGTNRLASVYWEPGQYQVVINFVLCLFIDELSDYTHISRLLRKFGVLFIALLMTISTTGYITFVIIMFAATLNAKVNSRQVFSYIIAIVVVLISTNMIYNSDAIQLKIEQSENERVKSSYNTRYDDNVALLRCTLERPIVGYGAGNDKLMYRLYNFGNETSSNGWLFLSAQMGVPIVFFLWLCMYGNIKRMFKGRLPILVLLALIISQAGEPSAFYPYIYMYVFRFASIDTNIAMLRSPHLANPE